MCVNVREHFFIQEISDDGNCELKTELLVKHFKESNEKSGEKEAMLDKSSDTDNKDTRAPLDHEV